jgi:hypothetical protein
VVGEGRTWSGLFVPTRVINPAFPRIPQLLFT